MHPSRSHDELFINIDTDFEAVITVDETSETGFPDTSQPLLLHFGGTDQESGSEITFGDYGFTGCIANVSYPIGRRRQYEWKRDDVLDKCSDQACFSADNKRCARNTGTEPKCRNVDKKCSSCESFFVPNCKIASKPSIYLSESVLVRDQIDAPFLNSRTNTIELSFRSHHTQGNEKYS